VDGREQVRILQIQSNDEKEYKQAKGISTSEERESVCVIKSTFLVGQSLSKHVNMKGRTWIDRSRSDPDTMSSLR
jgi:hypothetical protein